MKTREEHGEKRTREAWKRKRRKRNMQLEREKHAGTKNKEK